MKKNSKLHLMIETSLLDNLKNQANENRISIAELCREKLRESNQLDRIEFILNKLLKKKNEN